MRRRVLHVLVLALPLMAACKNDKPAAGSAPAAAHAAPTGVDTPEAKKLIAAGGRAAKAKETLEAAGFTHVVNGGGYRALDVP